MQPHIGLFTYPGSASFKGALGTLEFFQVATVVSSDGGGGAIFQRLAFNHASRFAPNGTDLRLFPVT